MNKSVDFRYLDLASIAESKINLSEIQSELDFLWIFVRQSSNFLAVYFLANVETSKFGQMFFPWSLILTSRAENKLDSWTKVHFCLRNQIRLSGLMMETIQEKFAWKFWNMLWKQVKVKVSKNVLETTFVYFNTREKKSLRYEEYFGDHFRVFQYQGAKSESESFK